MMRSGREPTHANANIDADARDSYLVSCFKPLSAQAFVIHRMDPHVVVFCPSALGRRVVGLSSQGTGPDLYSCPSWVRLVVLDTPADCNTGMEWIWCFSQQQKNAEKAYLATLEQSLASSRIGAGNCAAEYSVARRKHASCLLVGDRVAHPSG